VSKRGQEIIIVTCVYLQHRLRFKLVLRNKYNQLYSLIEECKTEFLWYIANSRDIHAKHIKKELSEITRTWKRGQESEDIFYTIMKNHTGSVIHVSRTSTIVDQAQGYDFDFVFRDNNRKTHIVKIDCKSSGDFCFRRPDGVYEINVRSVLGVEDTKNIWRDKLLSAIASKELNYKANSL